VQSLPEAEVKRPVGHSRSIDAFGTYGHELDGQREQIAAHVQEVFRSLLVAGKQNSTVNMKKPRRENSFTMRFFLWWR